MSAYFLTKPHIDAIVTAAADMYDYKNDREALKTLGQYLWWENVNSLEARYPNDDWTGERTEASGYTWQANYYEPVEILKALDCYEYQSCEHKNWPNSDGQRLAREIRSHVIGKLAGYDSAKWEIDTYKRSFLPTRVSA